MDLPIVVISLIMFLLIFVFLGTGMWVGFALASVGFFGLTVLMQGMDVIVAAVSFNTMASYTMAAVPLFIFMGEIILHSGMNEQLYSGVSRVTRVIPGGLVHSNIVACSLFAAVSGSSVATAATLGTVAYPEQRKRGYDKRLILGSISAGGTLGILIPPSITMILFSAFCTESVGQLFIGAVVPGIVMALSFMLYVFLRSLKNPTISPGREPITPGYFKDALFALKDIWPIIVLITVIMGGIYGGIVTPTEAAALACVVSVILAACFRKLTFHVVKEAALSTLRLSGAFSILIVGASIMGNSISMLRIPALLSESVIASGLDKMTVWLLICLLYMLLGCFMDGVSLLLITIPVTYPLIVKTLGFNGIWFGVLLTMLIECALITPPVGMNLYMLQTVTGQKDIKDCAIGAMPFFVIMLLNIALCTLFPQIILALPRAMFALK